MTPTRTRTRKTARAAQKTILLRLPADVYHAFRTTVAVRQHQLGRPESGNDILLSLVESWLTRQAA